MLRLAEWDGAEQHPLQRAKKVGEHEQRGGEARVRHGDVEGEEGVVDLGVFRSRVGVAVARGSRGRLVFAKSRTDLHKCQASSGICQVFKNTKTNMQNCWRCVFVNFDKNQECKSNMQNCWRC